MIDLEQVQQIELPVDITAENLIKTHYSINLVYRFAEQQYWASDARNKQNIIDYMTTTGYDKFFSLGQTFNFALNHVLLEQVQNAQINYCKLMIAEVGLRGDYHVTFLIYTHTNKKFSVNLVMMPPEYGPSRWKITRIHSGGTFIITKPSERVMPNRLYVDGKQSKWHFIKPHEWLMQHTTWAPNSLQQQVHVPTTDYSRDLSLFTTYPARTFEQFTSNFSHLSYTYRHATLRKKSVMFTEVVTLNIKYIYDVIQNTQSVIDGRMAGHIPNCANYIGTPYTEINVLFQYNYGGFSKPIQSIRFKNTLIYSIKVVALHDQQIQVSYGCKFIVTNKNGKEKAYWGLVEFKPEPRNVFVGGVLQVNISLVNGVPHNGVYSQKQFKHFTRETLIERIDNNGSAQQYTLFNAENLHIPGVPIIDATPLKSPPPKRTPPPNFRVLRSHSRAAKLSPGKKKYV